MRKLRVLKNILFYIVDYGGNDIVCAFRNCCFSYMIFGIKGGIVSWRITQSAYWIVKNIKKYDRMVERNRKESEEKVLNKSVFVKGV